MLPHSRLFLRFFTRVLILILIAVFFSVAAETDADAGTDPDETSPTPSLSPKWTPGNTPLSHLTIEQKEKIRSLKGKPVNTSIAKETPPITVPADLLEFFDWRSHNGDWITPVRDQSEECGSCWAHVVIGILMTECL